ncbi:unnamed protein product [Peronospora belbahrii]|nr:unnamed protein product [Peronospora belbahrii]
MKTSDLRGISTPDSKKKSTLKQQIPVVPVVAPIQTPPAVSTAPRDATNDHNNMETVEAQAKRAEFVSGDNGTGTSVFFAAAGGLGCVAIIAIVVYVKKPLHETKTMRNQDTDGMAGTTTMGARGSEESVYNDPLETRYSSIVMITPNGEGVCIL